jgi:hypothetical protein
MGRLSHNVGWHSGDIYSILTAYSVFNLPTWH